MIPLSSSTSNAVVPSITLQITKHDAEMFLDASKSLLSNLNEVQCGQAQDPRDESSDRLLFEKSSKPLHEMMYNIATESSHPVVVGFLSRLTSLLTPTGVDTDDASHRLHEIQAALLLFHDCDKTTKLKNLLSIFSYIEKQSTPSIHCDEEKKDDNPKIEKLGNEAIGLSHRATVSLFRTILTAISCCVHQPELHEIAIKGISSTENSASRVRTLEGESSERPLKKPKLEPSADSRSSEEIEKAEDEFGETNHCPSWDSLASLRDEDDVTSPASSNQSDLQHEILGIAEYAGQDLFAFIKKRRQQQMEQDSAELQDDIAVNLTNFSDWYNETGSTVVPWLELLQLSKWKPVAKKKSLIPVKRECTSDEDKVTVAPIVTSSSQAPLVKSPPPPPEGNTSTESETSKTMVSFDFTGSGSPKPLLINISEDNLLALQALIYQTQLINCNVSDICRILLRAGSDRTVNGQKFLVLRKHDFMKAIKQIIPTVAYNQISLPEQESFDESFTDFFFCFEENKDILHSDEVDLREFTVGFCLLCGGNKSSKLLRGFDLIDSASTGFLTETQLSRYLQSYLTMLVALSLIVPSSKKQARRPISRQRRRELQEAVESGANWTLNHFLKSVGDTRNEYTFETFARWYSDGGYAVAPWLELLDLKKVMSLIGEPHIHLHLPPLASLDNDYSTTKAISRKPRDRVSSLRRHHSSKRGPAQEILFTFPLGNRRSLVVLKEDALYVKDVVEKLGLLSMNPDYLWSALLKSVERKQKPSSREHIDMAFFVDCMKDLCSKQKRKVPASTVSYSIEEILSNFYQCFDIDQCDSVSLDELMGGLTLLCGGKKSTKLAFAFNIFDTRTGSKSDRKGHSLSGQDLFVFLRSVLIVTFSTCRQSLDMSDKSVSVCITDTANMICNDVMRHQWETKQLDRLDFDEFGQWYNEGGFERAPWLELLDLSKWVLLQNKPCSDGAAANVSNNSISASKVRNEVCEADSVPLLQTLSPTSPESALAPPPNDDALDNSFLEEIDSMDEMDMLLMQTSSADNNALKISKSFSYSTASPTESIVTRKAINPLKFHLVTTEEHGGYMLSLSTARITHFRRILESSGLYNLDVESACNHIINKGRTKLSKKCFDSAFQTLLSTQSQGLFVDKSTQKSINGVFDTLFKAFDREKSGEVSAIEVACGFTVLCRGKKSDKLEFAFEVLDKRKRGRLSISDMSNYLRSFLTVLLNVAFTPSLDCDPDDDTVCTMSGCSCDKSTDTLIRVVKAGADWAAQLAFRDFVPSRNEQRSSMSFDDFASWYTRTGYSSIPWLELLDLQKWAMVQ